MPELPETETIARDLDREITGRRIVGVRVERADVLRLVGARELARRVTGTTINRAWRRAKLVVLDLSSGDRVVVQPRFTGALLIDGGMLPDGERRYTAVEFELDDGRSLRYRDVRRLGTVALMSNEQFRQYSAALGAEPLDPAFTDAHLSALVRGRRQAIKKVLMDQRVIAGVGNIYANEALRGVLGESINHRGTSFRDYRDASGARGGFVEHLAVYGRAGRPCARCGRRLIGTHAIDGRMTVLCAHCQR